MGEKTDHPQCQQLLFVFEIVFYQSDCSRRDKRRRTFFPKKPRQTQNYESRPPDALSKASKFFLLHRRERCLKVAKENKFTVVAPPGFRISSALALVPTSYCSLIWFSSFYFPSVRHRKLFHVEHYTGIQWFLIQSLMGGMSNVRRKEFHLLKPCEEHKCQFYFDLVSFYEKIVELFA